MTIDRAKFGNRQSYQLLLPQHSIAILKFSAITLMTFSIRDKNSCNQVSLNLYRKIRPERGIH